MNYTTDMEQADWIVVGAGPAGIAAVGKLLDHAIPSEKIIWIDPAFRVGDLGEKWHSVPSNTKVELFLKFLQGCRSFGYSQQFPIDRLKPQDTCLLQEIATPLQWITDQLLKKVVHHRVEALGLNRMHGWWEVKTTGPTLRAKNLILAVGADSKTLPYSDLTAIPLEVALCPAKLKQVIDAKDVVAVFGSSHSAVLVLANLLQLELKKVYNFYRSPHVYAVDLEKWILFDDTGLKGFAATWARKNLDGSLPQKLERILVSDHAFEESLALCTKVVYAVGFERRKLPVLEQYENVQYHETTGIIAPGLFGLGIAFPQAKLDPLGNRTLRVGLWKFMDYLNAIFPIWLKIAHQ